jgi:putative transposase
VYQWVARAIAGFFGSRASLVAEKLCLRQQLLILQRRHPRPRLTDADRRFWILASRRFWGWRRTLLVVKPDTVIGWHRKGRRAYWRWRSRTPANSGRRPIRDEVRLLIRRLAAENILWGRRRIQAELARLGFKVSARTVAKYMRLPHDREPSPGWRSFLRRHAAEIWACDFFCVQSLWFRTLYAFFVVSHASREALHVEVTRHPTAEWGAQQIVECCG